MLSKNSHLMINRPHAGQCPSRAAVPFSSRGRRQILLACVETNAELMRVVDILPARYRAAALDLPEFPQLVEVIMDLGRPPFVRYASGEAPLSNEPTSYEDLQEAESKVGQFNQDNRAGLDGTLHRISCIRNRSGRIVGLTCRVGRSIVGSAALVADVIKEGRSLLLLGRPGVGKTTAVREIARMLSGPGIGKRTVIVDTSNEIGGDGDVPHAGIGNARRMQVADPEAQDRVMIEGVENHMPQAVIIDEISTEAECLAARTIAQRGVQLIATAHGNVLENVIKNPSLADLVGGITSVTLGDEAARKRGVQKTILERAAPPTFDVVAEMVDRTHWCIQDVASAVDIILQGGTSPGVMREHDEASGEVHGMDARPAEEVRSRGRNGQRQLLFTQSNGRGDERYRLNMSSTYQAGTGKSSPQPDKRPPPRILPMPGDFEEDPSWNASSPTASAVRRAAAEAVAAARGAKQTRMQPESKPALPGTVQPAPPSTPPSSPSPLSSTPSAPQGQASPTSLRSVAECLVWPDAVAAAAPSESMLQRPQSAADLTPTVRRNSVCAQAKRPRISVYLLMEQNASSKVVSVLRQLVAEVQEAAADADIMAPGVEVVDSLEEADLALATRAKLKNSPKVRAAIQRFKLPIYTLRSTSSTSILAKDLLPVLGLGPSATGLGKTTSHKPELDVDFQGPPSARALSRQNRSLGRSLFGSGMSTDNSKSAEKSRASTGGGGSGPFEDGSLLASHPINRMDSGDESSDTDSDSWERDSWERDSWPGNSDSCVDNLVQGGQEEGRKGSSELFEVSASPSAIARLNMRAGSGGNGDGGAAVITPADDYSDLICSLVRELRYSPLDREYSTQILNSFNTELALAAPASPASNTPTARAPVTAGVDRAFNSSSGSSSQVDGEGGSHVVHEAGRQDSGSERTSSTGSSNSSSRGYGCNAQSIAGLAWALSYTKHKKKFVHHNEAGLLSLAAAAEGRWHEFSGQSLMQIAMGFAGLRVLHSKHWVANLVEATKAAATKGKLTPHQAGAISQALTTLQSLKPSYECG